MGRERPSHPRQGGQRDHQEWRQEARQTAGSAEEEVRQMARHPTVVIELPNDLTLIGLNFFILYLTTFN